MRKKWILIGGVGAILVLLLLAILGPLRPAGRRPSRDPTWVDFDRLMSATTFVDVFTETQHVALRGRLLGDLKKVVFLIDGSLYACERNSIKKFDRNGYFVQEVAEGGEGPGRITRLFDACLARNGELWVLDKGISCLHFDSSGKFIGSTTLSERYDQIASTDQTTVFYCLARMHQDFMGLITYPHGASKPVEFAPPTEYLASFRRMGNQIPPPVGLAGCLQISGNKIHIIHPMEDRVRVFDAAGKEEREFVGQSDGFVVKNPAEQFVVTTPFADQFNTWITRLCVWRGLTFVVARDWRTNRSQLDVYDADGNRLNRRSLAFKELESRALPSSLFVDSRGVFWLVTQGKTGAGDEDENQGLMGFTFSALRE
jgi:hypothetical protein